MGLNGSRAVQKESRRRYAEGEDCHSNNDGECNDKRCPQLRDGEPAKSGRHCPLDSEASRADDLNDG